MSATLMKNNIDNQVAVTLPFNFCQPIYMSNLGEIKGLCLKSCYLMP